MQQSNLEITFSSSLIDELHTLAANISKSHSVLGLAYVEEKNLAEGFWVINILGEADYSRLEYLQIDKYRVVLITPRKAYLFNNKSIDFIDGKISISA